jgi:hypothetical protein
MKDKILTRKKNWKIKPKILLLKLTKVKKQLGIWNQVLVKYKVQYNNVIGQLTSWSLKMTRQWRKNEEMGVWDPGKEMAVFWK